MLQITNLLATSLDKMSFQKDELLRANRALTLALEEEHDRVLNLMRIISEINAEKLALTQKLEEANGELVKIQYADEKQKRS